VIDRLFRLALGPNDWLGRNECVCLTLIFVLVIVAGGFEHAA
jgi:hypothetical protein